ncbi:MAG: cysteine--tRNA ligase [Pseudomonadota bacterium]
MSLIEIQLYDTMSRAKRRLEPIDPENVRLYVCGPTVYDRAHIGNARSAIVFDLLFRLLRCVYGADHVTYVRNVTDVDDKINKRAAETLEPGESLNDAIRRITKTTLGWYREDMGALGVMAPTHEPRATDHIGGMIAMIERLIEKGAAYVAEGHALFSVGAYEGYGELARRSLEDMRAGARVEIAPYKRDPMDFVLWKPSTGDEPGWESPWGVGRPGWHIECSVMSEALLGPSFDIHGGGIDLAFPHHENERAQSMCCNPEASFATIWMHNGFLQVEGEKMSKSLGNFITVEDLRGRVPGEAARLAMLMTQYRQPLDWTAALGAEAEKTLRKWRRLTDGVEPTAKAPEGVLAALADDLNTPKALAELHALAHEPMADQFLAGARLLGLLTPELGAWAAAPEAGDDAAARIDALLGARAAARKAKDFARSDAIRDGLIAAGVAVKDTPKGAEWSLEPSFDPDALAALQAESET